MRSPVSVLSFCLYCRTFARNLPGCILGIGDHQHLSRSYFSICKTHLLPLSTLFLNIRN